MATYIYRVPRIGTGAEGDPFRPDLPEAPEGGAWEVLHDAGGATLVRANYDASAALHAVELTGEGLVAEAAALGLELVELLARPWPWGG